MCRKVKRSSIARIFGPAKRIRDEIENAVRGIVKDLFGATPCRMCCRYRLALILPQWLRFIKVKVLSFGKSFRRFFKK